MAADDERVSVDRRRCEGTGFCVQLLPHVFAMGEDGLARVLPGSTSTVDVEELEEAAALCPTQAILLRE